jgi:hypothetical protein
MDFHLIVRLDSDHFSRTARSRTQLGASIGKPWCIIYSAEISSDCENSCVTKNVQLLN